MIPLTPVPTHHHSPTGGESSAIDPVCGMTVDPATAAGAFDYKGTRYCFCNPSCLAKFKANPESYLSTEKAKGRSSASHEAPGSPDILYTCPMHPEVVQRGPG